MILAAVAATAYPSRPWNHFSIELEDADGSERLHYQGNWRDIFQNWEALAVSFPGYIESFIAKFVNASTADGHNPYRISREGIDWETLDPGNSWANIGYWGDHQIVYLLRLLRLSRDHHPGLLAQWLQQESFVYADVPYRIKPYRDLITDPRNTIEYDDDRARAVAERVAALGADGKLVVLEDGTIHRVNLLEKLLLPALDEARQPRSRRRHLDEHPAARSGTTRTTRWWGTGSPWSPWPTCVRYLCLLDDLLDDRGSAGEHGGVVRGGRAFTRRRRGTAGPRRTARRARRRRRPQVVHGRHEER